MNRKPIVSLRTYASIAAEQRRKQERERIALVAFVVAFVGYFGAHIIAAIVR